MEAAITVDHISKSFRLGVIGRQTLSDEVAYRFHRIVKGRAAAERTWESQAVSKAVPKEARRLRHNEEFWALRDISFDVKQGEVLGIIGKNGAGKSTLLKVLTRITEPTSGEAIINGRVASLLEVGTGFHPELTGRENVYLNGTILGMSRREIDSKFTEIVEFSEIDKFIDTPVKRYSSGMYVRLAFAVAAHLDPEILLIDEVLAVGDVNFQKKCLGKMSRVAREGRTVLFVSHNMTAVRSLCHRGLLLKGGCVEKIGPVQDVVEHYGSHGSLSAEYLREPPEGQPFAFTRMALMKHGVTSAAFSTNDTIRLEIECRIVERIPDLRIYFEVMTGLQECVFTSTHLDVGGLEDCPPAGSYRYTCEVPLEQYREGRYYVRACAFMRGDIYHDVVDEPLVFDIVDDPPACRRIARSRKGMIAPCLPWNLQKLD